jgi:hypothetical protein
LYEGKIMANTTFSGPVISNNGFIGGTASDPIVVTTAQNINKSYATTSAVSGDTRLVYDKLTFTAAGSGETLRAFSVVTTATAAVGGTINGAHISLEVDGTGAISGAGNAIRATLGGTKTSQTGTLSVIQADTNFGAGVTVPASASFIRVTDSGATTGAITNLFNLPSALVPVKSAAAVSHTIKIMVGSTPYYLMVSNAQ